MQEFNSVMSVGAGVNMSTSVGVTAPGMQKDLFQTPDSPDFKREPESICTFFFFFLCHSLTQTDLLIVVSIIRQKLITKNRW